MLLTSMVLTRPPATNTNTTPIGLRFIRSKQKTSLKQKLINLKESLQAQKSRQKKDNTCRITGTSYQMRDMRGHCKYRKRYATEYDPISTFLEWRDWRLAWKSLGRCGIMEAVDIAYLICDCTCHANHHSSSPLVLVQ